MNGNGAKTKQFGYKAAIVAVTIVVVGGAGLFGAALYTGATTVPPETVTQLWLGVGTVFTTAVIAAVGWLNARTLRLSTEAADRRTARIQAEAAQQVEAIRLEAARHAEMLRVEAAAEAERNRAHSDQNALQTQGRVEKLIVDVNDGLISKINEGTRALVKEDNVKAAEVLASVNASAAATAEAARVAAQVATNSQNIQKMMDKLDVLLAPPPPPPLPDVATGPLVLAGMKTPLDATLQAIETHTAETAQNTRTDEPEGSAV